MSPKIDIDTSAIATFCEKHSIRKLSLFGSVLRDDFQIDSDVDVLVEFMDGHVPGFFRLGDMEAELGELLGRRVDLRLPNDLSQYFRNEVIQNAYVQYVA